MEEAMSFPSSFLLVEFGSTFIKFFLVLKTDSRFGIKASVEIPSFLGNNKEEAENLFFEGIKRLEFKSGRKLLYKNLLLIKKGTSEGIEKVLFSGDEDFKNQLPSFQETPFLPRSENLKQAVSFLSEFFPEIFILDVGSSTTQFAFLENKKDFRAKFLEFGVGKSARKSLDKIGDMQRILRWLSFKADLDEVEDYLGNKVIYPATLPVNKKDLEIEQAMVREIIRGCLDLDFPPPNFLLLSGKSLVSTPRFGQTALMVFDGLEPEGVQAVLVDVNQFLGVLGHLALICPLAARSLVEKSNIFPKKAILASISCKPKGKGRNVGEVKFDFGMDRKGKINLEWGDVYLIPEKETEVGVLFDLNQPYFIKGLAESSKKEEKGKTKSQLGVIIDARGRPLVLPELGSKNREKINTWYKALEVGDY